MRSRERDRELTAWSIIPLVPTALFMLVGRGEPGLSHTDRCQPCDPPHPGQTGGRATLHRHTNDARAALLGQGDRPGADREPSMTPSLLHSASD
ncbi:hypothetical protein SKAU_G00069590 [Synaphobranchus kaupii]|uniref:Uncharacterized protein n=1 Tax=Synaphobranchus kaupii TaxID=118154 RepID=A0A9Q1J9D7_SYNKA|nr:hypothetical protein SKAU_G00069590 [Synaphobranchus kaupii]